MDGYFQQLVAKSIAVVAIITVEPPRPIPAVLVAVLGFAVVVYVFPILLYYLHN